MSLRENLFQYIRSKLFRVISLWSLEWASRLLPHQEIQALRSVGGSRNNFRRQGKKITIFATRTWPYFKALEGVFGRALLERGHRIEGLYAAGLPYLESDPELLNGLDLKLREEEIENYIRALFSQFGISTTPFSDWVLKEDTKVIRRALDEHDGEWENFQFRGRPVGEWTQTSVRWRLARRTLDESDSAIQDLWSRILQSACQVFVGAERYFRECNPDCVLLVNGIFAPERVILELASELGIRVVTCERGLLRNSIVCAHNKPAGYYYLEPEWKVRKQTPLTESENNQIRSYLGDRARGSADSAVDQLDHVDIQHRHQIEYEIGTSLDEHTLVLFPNIVWDSAALARNIAFENLIDWILETVEVISNVKEKKLIIRAHPAEVKLWKETSEKVKERLEEAYTKLPENVYFIPPESDVSSYTLMEESEAVLVYTSTTGIEAAIRGCPVIVAGETHYRDKGWTIDVTSREQYRRLLKEDLGDKAPSEDDVKRALRYAHLFFFEAHFQVPFIQRTSSGTIEYNLKHTSELEPGESEVLDRLCDSIVKGKSFIYPNKCGNEVTDEVNKGVFKR